MIHNIIFFHTVTGRAIFQIPSETENDVLWKMGAFFSALNSFMIQEIFRESFRLKKIELDNYIIKFITINITTFYDFIITYDYIDNERIIENVINKIKDISYSNAKTFQKWDGYTVTVFNKIENEIKDIIKRTNQKINLKCETINI